MDRRLTLDGRRPRPLTPGRSGGRSLHKLVQVEAGPVARPERRNFHPLEGAAQVQGKALARFQALLPPQRRVEAVALRKARRAHEPGHGQSELLVTLFARRPCRGSVHGIVFDVDIHTPVDRMGKHASGGRILLPPRAIRIWDTAQI